jgi:RimJ/RimL family protein N-acetyltransferase
MITLTPFQEKDFQRLIRWIDNPELLITIAGNVWSYPLTVVQLQRYLDDTKSYSFNIVETPQDIVVGHAEIILAGDGTCKIDKLLVDASHRGKGFCPKIINALLTYAFDKLPVHTVELNVFDWNTAGIRCYERSGFSFNPEKKQLFPLDDKSWTAVNMSITKARFLSMGNVAS